MTTRPRRDSTSSLAAAIQAKEKKDAIGDHMELSRKYSSAKEKAKEKASSAAAEEVDPVAVSGGRKAVVRMDRDRETENEARKLNAKSPTKDKDKESSSRSREGGSSSRSRERVER